MEVKSSSQDAAAIVEPSGIIDTRASIAFEQAILDQLETGKRQFAIDFTKVELITSAGIRVLVMLAQRLQGIDGALVLFALSNEVRTVFDIAGLLPQFRVATSREEALQQLASDPSANSPATSPSSKVARLAMRLLAGDADADPQPGAARAAADRSARSQLTVEVASLLSKREG